MRKIFYFLWLVVLLPLFCHGQETGTVIPLKNINAAKVAYNRGVESVNSKNWMVALEYLSTALDLNPEFAAAYLMRGKTNLQLDQVQEAIQDFTMAIQMDNNLGEANFYRGYAKMDDQANPEVLEDFDQSISKGFKEYFVYYYRGLFKLVSGDYPGAILDFTNAIDIQSEYIPSSQDVGTRRRYLGTNVSSATPSPGKIFDQRTLYALTFHDRGTAKRLLGDYQGAIYDYRQAVNYKPDFSMAFNNMGSVKKMLGDFQGAVDDYTVAVRLDSTYYIAYNNRGSTKFQMGDFNGALEDFNKVISLESNHAPTLNNLGGALAKINRLDEAVTIYDQVILEDPSFGYAYLNRGLVRELLGDLNGACQDWKKAIELGITEADPFIKECE